MHFANLLTNTEKPKESNDLVFVRKEDLFILDPTKILKLSNSYLIKTE